VHRGLEIEPLAGWQTLPEVADALGLSRQQVHKLIDARKFDTVRRVGAVAKPVYLIADASVTKLVQERAARLVRPDAEDV
jgi:hypothetical protein